MVSFVYDFVSEKSIYLGIRGFSAKNSFLDTFSETAPLKFLIFSMITEGGKSLELSIWEIIYILYNYIYIYYIIGKNLHLRSLR